MATIQTSGLGLPSHPVLYGTTLAISLVGSVAALNPGGLTLPAAGIEAALGLAGSASAAEPASPAPPAQVPETIGADAAASHDTAGFGTTPEYKLALTTERPTVPEQVGPQIAQHTARLEVAKAAPATGLQQELKTPPQAAPAPEIVAVKEPQHDQSATAPLDPAVATPAAAAPSGPSFNEAFQVVPMPSLVAAPESLRALPSAETVAAPKASPALVAPEPVVPALGGEPAAAAFAQPQAASPAVPNAPAAHIVAALNPAAAAPALAAQPELVSNAAAPSAAPRAEPSAQASAPAPTPMAQPLHLVSSPQLRKFDLARIHVLPPAPPATLAPSRARPDRLGNVRHAGAKDRLVEGTVFHRVTVTVAGSALRTLELKIGADMKPSIKVGDLLGLVSDRMDPASVARFESAASAQVYVSLADLRAAGFNVSYNAGADSISITAGE